jgi:hypothetical protein
LFTVWVSRPVDPRNTELGVGVYTALSGCEPAVRALVVQGAKAGVPDNGTSVHPGIATGEPVMESKKVTVPVGVGPSLWTGVTSAVKVTDVPSVDGLRLDVSTVFVGTLTIWLTLPLDPEKTVSPL